MWYTVQSHAAWQQEPENLVKNSCATQSGAHVEHGARVTVLCVRVFH